jgi:hypothetical protein
VGEVTTFNLLLPLTLELGKVKALAKAAHEAINKNSFIPPLRGL